MRRVFEFGVGAGAAAVVAIGLALPAQATQICNDLSDCSYKLDHYTGRGAQPKAAPWGKITISQVDGGVEVSIILRRKTSFVENGGGDAFMFNLSPQIAAANILASSNGFTFDPHVGKTSAGNWQYGMICNVCGNGPSKVKKLDFVITGITLADFLTNDKDFSFGADLCFNIRKKRGSCKRIGNAVAGSFIAPVPEPVSLSLFGVGLFAMGATAGRRWRKRSAITAA